MAALCVTAMVCQYGARSPVTVERCMKHYPSRGPIGDRFTRFGVRPLAAATSLCAACAALVVWLVPQAVGGAWWCAVPGALWLFVLSFFRNPRRAIRTDDAVVLSAADGRVLDVAHIDAEEFIGGPATRISVFLSVFDVHVNRAPVAGRVAYLDYMRGTFRSATRRDVRDTNERQSIGQEMADGTRVLTRQIAGLIARRIVCPLEEGAHLAQGVDFGMIRFGSQTDVSVSDRNGLRFHARVRAGDVVRGGRTILGEWSAGPPPG